jgi:hypothetical protein
MLHKNQLYTHKIFVAHVPRNRLLFRDLLEKSEICISEIATFRRQPPHTAKMKREKEIITSSAFITSLNY